MSTGKQAKGQQELNKTVVDRPGVPPSHPDDHKRTTVDVGAAEAAFFTDIKSELLSRDVDKNILLNIPIWGWTGDGKTCALLTALHYCEPSQHILGLALVTDSDDLINLEMAAEPYRGLNLVSIAAATKQRFANLSRLLIDENAWPPGTDEATCYIFSVWSLTGPRGYVMFPDLKGGSFREHDQVAREILKKAHACVILVNPTTYASYSTEGRRYVAEIAGRLNKCAEMGIPVCILITRSDLQETATAADETHKSLTILLESRKDFDAKIFRVSVLGDSIRPPSKQLPPASERKPDQLVRAFVWILCRALLSKPDAVRAVVPPVHLRSIEEPAVRIPSKRISELRSVGHFSERPGKIVCASSDDPRTFAFVFVDDAGELTELTLSKDDRSVEKRQRMGVINGWDSEQDDQMQSYYIAGELLIGPRRHANALWHGSKGDSLIKVTLPFEIVSWAPAAQRRIVAVDSVGRLQSLVLEGEKWRQIGYVGDVIKPTPLLLCGMLESAHHVFVFNGVKVEAVAISPSGEFGDRFSPVFVAQYDTEEVRFNNAGLFAALNSNGEVIASASEKMHKLGTVEGDVGQGFAIAPAARVLAVVGADLRLTASLIQGDKMKTTSAEYSPQLPSEPTSMAWTPDGALLAVTYADDTWAVFRPYGLVME